MGIKMVYIEAESKNAAFHFSVEEYIMRCFPFNEPVMMIWQADKCAMLGRNQIAEAEIDISCVRQEGIQIIRRSSGGGTIFTDAGTLLYTMILPDAEQYSLDTAREKIAAPVVKALNEMGIPAKLEGRNDILVEGKKVSGMAQYARHDRICTHGSLLYDTDLEMLTRVLRVDEGKISSKGLRSVRSRVVNLKEYMDSSCSTYDFWALLKKNLFSGQYIEKYALTEYDLTQIDLIFQEQYGNPSWTFEQSPRFSFHNSKRFYGGKVEVYLDIDKGAVSSCSIRGDFLGVFPIRGLEMLFENKLFQYEVFSGALDGISLQPYLGNITVDEFLSCMFN